MERAGAWVRHLHVELLRRDLDARSGHVHSPLDLRRRSRRRDRLRAGTRPFTQRNTRTSVDGSETKWELAELG